MSTKEVLLEMAEKLPSDATLLEAAAELEARHAAMAADLDIETPAWHEAILKKRLQSIAEGKAEFFTIEEAREMLRKERS